MVLVWSSSDSERDMLPELLMPPLVCSAFLKAARKVSINGYMANFQHLVSISCFMEDLKSSSRSLRYFDANLDNSDKMVN